MEDSRKNYKKLFLKGKEPITVRPGELLEDVDFKALKDELYKEIGREVTSFDVIAYALYPKVFLEYVKHVTNNLVMFLY